MALTATTLAAPCAVSDTRITVASATGFAVGNIVLVENELMQQTAAAAGLVVPVRRGLDGTVQGAHATGAFAATGLGSDFPGPAAGQEVVYSPAAPDGMQQGWGYFTYSAAGAIPVVSGVHTINGSGATAMTIGAPTVAQEGAELRILSKNLHANTVVATPAYLGASGGTATFAATGGNLLLKVVGGKLSVLASSGVTFT
jgi:hypothetical protein